MTLDVAAPASLAQVTIKSARFKIMTKNSSLIILQPLNIPLKTMTGPGPSNCSERVLKVTMFHMLARKKQTKVQLSSFFFVSGSILANHRTSSSRILQSKKVKPSSVSVYLFTFQHTVASLYQPYRLGPWTASPSYRSSWSQHCPSCPHFWIPPNRPLVPGSMSNRPPWKVESHVLKVKTI